MISLPTFDRNFWIEQLKKEVGLPDIPYEELNNYEVNLDSVTGKDSVGFTKNAKEYVDEQLLVLENQYADFSEQMKDQTYNPMLLETKPMEILTPVQSEFDPEKIKVFDMTIEGRNLSVLIHDKPEQENFLRKHWSYVGERTKNELTGLETICSFYQFTNSYGHLKNPEEKLSDYEDIGKKMTMVFDGLKFEGLDG